MIENSMNTWSHSRINTFKQCPKMYQYKYINKLEPLGTKEALNIGKAFHYGIEKNSSEAALEYMENENMFMDEKAETNKALVLAMVDCYLERWGDEKKEREIEFHYKLNDHDELLGYIDGIIETDEGYWLEEDKTASMVNKEYIDKLQFIDQPTRYMIAAEEMYKDKPILGIKYRILRKPMIRQKQGESIEQFRKRLVDKYKEEDYIFEFTLTRTKEDLEECKLDLLEDIRTIETSTRFTKNLGSCSMYGRCPYMELCMKEENANLLYIERKEDQDVAGE